MSKKKTHEEYVSDVIKVNPNIEVVGEYTGNKNKVLHRCKIDGYEWYATPNNILKGSGCPKCCGRQKITHEEYVAKVMDINQDIEVIGLYVGQKKRILHRCKIDGHEWYASPGNILKGYGCPKCGGTSLKTHEEYVEELKIKNPFTIVIGQYINTKTKILHKCLAHNIEWEITPYCALRGHGCPKCKVSKLTRKHEEYVEEVANINKDVEVIGKYAGSGVHILHRCLICDYKWNTTPDIILHGHGCPQCHKAGTSNGEKIVSSWLDEHKIMYEKQKTFDGCKDKISLRFDFYLPYYNVCIEYQGKQHYEPIEYFGGEEDFKTRIRRDKIKEDYCKENNITLFKIPYYSDICEEMEKIYYLIMKDNTIEEVAV